MVQREDLTRFAADLYLRPAGQVLAEVIDQLAFGGNKGLLRIQAHQAAYRLVLLTDQAVKAVFIADRHAEGLLFGGGILGLAIVDLGETDHSGGDLPGLTGADHVRAAVCIFDTEHRQQGRPVAVVIGLGIKAQLAAVPAAAQGETQLVDAVGQGHRVGLVLESRVVVSSSVSPQKILVKTGLEASSAGSGWVIQSA